MFQNRFRQRKIQNFQVPEFAQKLLTNWFCIRIQISSIPVNFRRALHISIEKGYEHCKACIPFDFRNIIWHIEELMKL